MHKLVITSLNCDNTKRGQIKRSKSFFYDAIENNIGRFVHINAICTIFVDGKINTYAAPQKTQVIKAIG